MKEAILISNRGLNDKQVNGTLSVFENGKEIFTCKTLELPDKANKPMVSCIPTGQYKCTYNFSPHFERKLYQILNVPNRSGIRIHPANYARQLLGCIALGSALKDIDMDGQNDTIHSGATCKRFEEIMNYEDFTLTIK